MIRPWRSKALDAAGTYAVGFDAYGTAHFGELSLAMQLDGLVVDSQRRLSLAELPVWPNLQPTSDAPTTRPGAMAFWRGRVYFTAVDGRSVLVRDCDGGVATFVDLRDPTTSTSVTDLASLATTLRDTLLVVDHGKATVHEFDLTTAQVVWRWFDLDDVQDVTVTASGTVYAACRRGIVRLDPYDGAIDVPTPVPNNARPTSLAWATIDDAEVLFVLVDAGVRVVDLRPAGSDHQALESALDRLIQGCAAPMAARWRAGRLYAGSPGSRAIRAFEIESISSLGDLPGRPYSYSSFGIDDEGTVWITDGVSAAMSPMSRPVDVGAARIGPIPIRLDNASEHTLRVRLVRRLSTARAVVAAEFEPHADGSGAGDSSDTIRTVPDDATGLTIHVRLIAPSNAPDVVGRPHSIDSIELRIDEAGWIDQLPSIYRDDNAHPELFLDPFLRLARTGLDEVVDGLLALPQEIDPATSTDDLTGDRWLDWLATWVDIDLDETRPSIDRRASVAKAFWLHGLRGTSRGLRELIAAELGLNDVVIVQRGDAASVWVLGDETCELGLQTMTAAAPPNGSMIDVTAVADQSHLIGPADYGAPLFGDLANTFDILVHAAWIRCPDDRRRLEALIQRERPAHTTAHLCVIDPGISIGIQARIGIDFVIGVAQHPHAVGGLEGFVTGDRPTPFVLGRDDREELVLI